MVRPIWAVCVPDRTAAKSGRCGHVGQSAFGGRIHMEMIRIPRLPIIVLKGCISNKQNFKGLS
jgi:hypothetical protein